MSRLQRCFWQTAENEREHAKIWFRELEGIGSTAQNLLAAAAANTMSGRICTSGLHRRPSSEGFLELSNRFRMVAAIEKHHEERFRALLQNVENGTVFQRDEQDTVWICRNCGHIVVGARAPQICPSATTRRHF